MGTILIIADPQDRCYATPRGLELARRLGHKAEIVAFTYANLKSLKLVRWHYRLPSYENTFCSLVRPHSRRIMILNYVYLGF